MGFVRIYGLLILALAFTAFSIWNSAVDGDGSWAFVAAGVGFSFLSLQRANRLKGATNAR